MPYLARSIGLFEFSFLHGPIQMNEDTVEVLERPGVDGAAYRTLGQRSPEFELQSKVGVVGYKNGLLLVQRYKELVGANSQTIVWEGINLTTDPTLDTNYRAMVLGVEKEALRVASLTGNVPAGSNSWLECIWRIQLVAV